MSDEAIHEPQNVDASMPSGLTGRFSEDSPSRLSWVRSTARVRSSPTKGRSMRVKPLVSRRARDGAVHSLVLQTAIWWKQRHKTTSRDSQEHHWTVAGDTDSACQNRFCFSAFHRFGGADEAADCLSTATHRHRYLRNAARRSFHRCGASSEHCCCASAAAAPKTWARIKRTQATSPRPST